MESFSPDQKHIIITYHYVEEPSPLKKGIFPCSPQEFERQIAYLKENYTITTVDEVALLARENSATRTCAITFDDGLKDQFQFAYPILKKHGVPATFYIITSTFDNIMPTTQQIHLLLNHKDAATLVALSNDFFKEKLPEHFDEYFIPSDRRLTDKRKIYHDIVTGNFRERLNTLPVSIRHNLLAYLFDALDLKLTTIVPEYFMTEDEIRTLHKEGHAVGSHSHSHELLDEKSDESRESLLLSKKRLESLTDTITSFCYPLGIWNEATRAMLGNEGFTTGVTIEQRSVTPEDHALSLPRYDTNQIRDFLKAQS